MGARKRISAEARKDARKNMEEWKFFVHWAF